MVLEFYDAQFPSNWRTKKLKKPIGSYLGEPLREFKRSYPELKLKLMIADNRAAQESVMEDKADLALPREADARTSVLPARDHSGREFLNLSCPWAILEIAFSPHFGCQTGTAMTTVLHSWTSFRWRYPFVKNPIGLPDGSFGVRLKSVASQKPKAPLGKPFA